MQLYSAMVYRGPGLVPDIKAGLLAAMRREKLPGIPALVGRKAAAMCAEPFPA